MTFWPFFLYTVLVFALGAGLDRLLVKIRDTRREIWEIKRQKGAEALFDRSCPGVRDSMKDVRSEFLKRKVKEYQEHHPQHDPTMQDDSQNPACDPTLKP